MSYIINKKSLLKKSRRTSLYHIRNELQYHRQTGRLIYQESGYRALHE
uniref:Uncharacterized protein n=1 Tax=Klebsiella pneumoniae TaxID=573 RepID=A0A8B0STX0_KLEPN|nr:hypothetical protein [Klebsiella pneumoniae]